MRITFKNFRCYESDTFTFDDIGLLLLRGESGVGKTTILKGIVHALYGKTRKPYTIGKKTCSVSLNIKDIEIYRSNAPNRLLLTKGASTFEDAEAQSIIDGIYGTYDEFMASSFITQKSQTSILTMTPAEQLLFVKKIANTGGDAERTREVLNARIAAEDKELTAELSVLQRNEEILKEVLAKEVKPAEYPFQSEQEEKEAVKLKRVYKKDIDARKLVIETLRKRIASMNVEEYNSLRKQISTIQIEISQLEQQMARKHQEFNDDEIQKLEAALVELKEAKRVNELILARQDLEEKMKRYSSAASAKSSKGDILTDKQLASVKSKIARWRSYELKLQSYNDEKARIDTEYQSVINAMNANERFANSFKTFAALLRFLNTVKGELEKELSKSGDIHEYHQCPSCQQVFYVDDKKQSVKVDAIPQETADSSVYKQDYALCQEFINSLDSIKARRAKLIAPNKPLLTESSTEIMEKIVRKHELAIMAADPDSAVMDELTKDLNNLTLQIGSGEIAKDVDKDIERTTKDIEKFYALRSELKSLEIDLLAKKKRKNSLNTKIKGLGDVAFVEDVKRELQENIRELENVNEKYVEIVEKLQLMTLYNNYVAYQKRVDDARGYVRRSRELIDVLETNKKRLLELRNIVRDAELYAIDSVVESINTHAQIYIEHMFESGEMIARLENVKQTQKDTKAGMNTNIQYKGSQYSSVDQLSGGELDRLNLCFILAVNDLVNSSMLLLDECLASLDADTNTHVFTLLKEVGKNRCIMVVSHEALEGVFDNVYHIKK